LEHEDLSILRTLTQLQYDNKSAGLKFNVRFLTLLEIIIMCTLALYYKTFPGYPIVVAANRDEHYDRPSAPPAIIGTSPTIVAGRDLRAGGTWLGINEYGLLVGILNRRQKPGTVARATYRSRGLLCLDLLRLKQLDQLEQIFVDLAPADYPPFTVVCVDTDRACVAYNTDQAIERIWLSAGLHVFSNSFEFGAPSQKVDRVHERFLELAAVRDRSISRGDYVDGAAKALGDHALGDHLSDPGAAICVHGDISGTVSSSIIFCSDAERQFQMYYCGGAPCRNPFTLYSTLDVR
jgi:uncharacterized protein with NRDE domain